MQLMFIYHVHNTTWPWARLKVHKGHPKVNVKLVRYFDVENISVNLQHDKAIYEELSCSQGSGRCPTPIHLPTQATTIPSNLRWPRGKKCHVFKYWGLSLCVEAQELMRFHQDERPALIVMKGNKPWIMYDGAEHEAHILDCSEVVTGGGGF